MTAPSLIERLEGAERGSRELDAEIDAHLFGGRSSKDFTRDAPGGALRASYSAGTVFLNSDPEHNGGNVCTSHHRMAGPYTTSLDAALALAERLGLDARLILKVAVTAWLASDSLSASDAARLACIAILRARKDTL